MSSENSEENCSGPKENFINFHVDEEIQLVNDELKKVKEWNDNLSNMNFDELKKVDEAIMKIFWTLKDFEFSVKYSKWSQLNNFILKTCQFLREEISEINLWQTDLDDKEPIYSLETDEGLARKCLLEYERELRHLKTLIESALKNSQIDELISLKHRVALLSLKPELNEFIYRCGLKPENENNSIVIRSASFKEECLLTSNNLKARIEQLDVSGNEQNIEQFLEILRLKFSYADPNNDKCFKGLDDCKEMIQKLLIEVESAEANWKHLGIKDFITIKNEMKEKLTEIEGFIGQTEREKENSERIIGEIDFFIKETRKNSKSKN